jgi:hypothetical protein
MPLGFGGFLWVREDPCRSSRSLENDGGNRVIERLLSLPLRRCLRFPIRQHRSRGKGVAIASARANARPPVVLCTPPRFKPDANGGERKDGVTDQCKKCGRDLELPTTGRPPDYCSKGCRRAVEYELRRIQRRLEGLEVQEASARRELEPAAARLGGSPEFRRAQHRWYAGEIDRLEKRLHQLLD